MDYNKKRVSSNVKVRNEGITDQPRSVQNKEAGRGNKKLEGPNRPST
jgi:hypothetical protein